MTNSSSLSKAAMLGGISLGTLVLDAGLTLVFDIFSPLGSLAADAVAIAGLLGAGWYFRAAFETLGRAATVCSAAAAGDLEARIFELPEPGVVGRIQRGINEMLDMTDAFVREARGSAQYCSQRKFFRKVLLRGLPGTFENAARTLNEASGTMEASLHDFTRFAEANVGSVVTGITSAAGRMRTSAEAMTRTAGHTNEQASAAAAATHQASANVQTVATAAEQLSTSVSEIGRQVAHSSQMAQRAVQEAERTNTTVMSLSEAAQRVGDVVQLINEIAGKTNLLALNATIEAARAGDAGKGFAVVASEVKSLAAQTARATGEISAQVAAIQTATGEAVTAIQGIGAMILDMNGVTSTIAAAIEQQGAATREIARNVQEAAAGTQEISGNIVNVTEAAGEAGSAAGEVLEAASALAREAERLGAEIGVFLQKAQVA